MSWLSGAAGWRKVTRVEPSGIISTSCFFFSSLNIGCLTLRMMSAPANSCSTSLTIVAPAFSYSESSMKMPAPAPLSTATSNPLLRSFSTVSGMAATRFSAFRISFGTAIRIG